VLSQKLRNYFHHVVNLQTEKILDYKSNKELIQSLKRNSLYTGLYRSFLASIKHKGGNVSLSDFKWNASLLSQYENIDSLDDFGHLDRDVTNACKEFILEKVKNLPKPNFTDEEKVQQFIQHETTLLDFNEMLEREQADDKEYINHHYKEYLNRLQEAYDNWKESDFKKPSMNYEPS